ncbi:MAG TPA: tetratricopeptide repeat protein [Fimbriimonadaceae bacterium]|nr:tetratricopeptide repeat protein [Fimbriimonadaceae bacterium]
MTAEPESDPIQLARQAEFSLPRAEFLAEVDALATGHPDNEEMLGFRTEALLECGEFERAGAAAEAHLAHGSTPQAIAGRGLVSLYTGNAEACSRSVAEALAAAPDSPFVMRVAGNLAAITGDRDEGVRLARRLLELEPEEPRSYHRVFSQYIASSKLDEAASFLASAPDWYQASYWSDLNEARLATRARDLPGAEAHLRSAIAKRPENGIAWGELGIVLNALGRVDEAESAAGFALERNPRSPIAFRVLAAVARQRGKRALYEEYERKATEAMPALSGFQHSAAGADFLRRGMKEEALNAYREMAKSGPPSGRGVAASMVLTLLADLNRWSELRSALAKQMDGDAPAGAVAMARARLLVHDGKEPEAEEVLRGAVDDPVHGLNAKVQLVQLLSKRGDSDAADAILKEIPRTALGSPDRYGLVFMALKSHGRDAEAAEVLAAGRREFPEAQNLRLLEAADLMRSGNKDMARQALRGLSPELKQRFRPRASQILMRGAFWRALLKAIWRRITGGRPKS